MRRSSLPLGVRRARPVHAASTLTEYLYISVIFWATKHSVELNTWTGTSLASLDNPLSQRDIPIAANRRSQKNV